MSTVNYDIADKMVGVSTEKRQEMDKAGRFGRAAALSKSSDSSDNEETPAKKLGNVVEKELAAEKAERAYEGVFSRVSEASYAARSACQKQSEGVQSEKERDAILSRCLNDLITVIEGIRDDRKDIIAERSKEEQNHSLLLS